MTKAIVSLLILWGIASGSAAASDAASDLDEAIPVFLTEFVLLDENGKAAPSQTADGKTVPFGVLLEFSSPRYAAGGRLEFNLKLCTAVHWKRVGAITHSSCLSRTLNGDRTRLFVIFYDKQGNKKAYGLSTPTVGKNTVRVHLPLPPTVVDEWESYDPLNLDASRIWPNPATTPVVDVWAYDALADRPELRNRFRGADGGVPYGMVASPRRQCRARAAASPLEIFDRNDPTVTARVEFVFPADFGRLLFLEGCDHVFLGGNVGALITPASDFSSPLALFHGSVDYGTLAAVLQQQVPAQAARFPAPLQALFADLPRSAIGYPALDGNVYEVDLFDPARTRSSLFSFGALWDYLERAWGPAPPPARGHLRLPVDASQEKDNATP